jgi:hypothetical protein
MNSPPPPDLDALHPATVLRELRALAVRLRALEIRVVAYPPLSATHFSQPSKTAKKSNFPPPIPTTNYRLPKTEVEGSEKGKERLEGKET